MTPPSAMTAMAMPSTNGTAASVRAAVSRELTLARRPPLQTSQARMANATTRAMPVVVIR